MFDPRVNLRRYEKEVTAIEQNPVRKGQIIFYGSSTFNNWREKEKNHNLEDDLLGKDGKPACLNHAFGGCTAEELLYYYPRLIKPYEPRALVVCVFPNDRGAGYSPMEVMANLSKLLAWARTDFPGIRLYLCDCRPVLNIDGIQVPNNMREYHKLMRHYCAEHPDTTYVAHEECPDFWIDPQDAGSFEGSKIRKELFIADRVHFNQNGYDIYKKFFANVLDDIL